MSVNVYRIQLVPRAQRLTVTLNDVSYALVVRWCSPIECWVLDIYTGADGELLIGGIPLVTGIDLLGQYAYLDIGGRFFVRSDKDPDAIPTYTNLGSESHLYFVVPE